MAQKVTAQQMLNKINIAIRGKSGVPARDSLELISEITWLDLLRMATNYNILSGNKIFPKQFNWQNWATNKDLTGIDLLEFVNHLVRYIRYRYDTWSNSAKYPLRRLLALALSESDNYFHDGDTLRILLNTINLVDINTTWGQQQNSHLYMDIVRGLQTQKKNGQFHTDDAVVREMIKRLKPHIGETVADYACGSGTFLTEAYNYMKKQVKNTKQDKILNNDTLHGQEIQTVAYIITVVNLMSKGIANPNVKRCNSLSKSLDTYTISEKADVIAMNPPFGDDSNTDDINSMPSWFSESRLEIEFMMLIMKRLRKNGRAGIIVPDSVLNDSNSSAIKMRKQLVNDFNITEIDRLPKGIFLPYTPLNVNIIYFRNNGSTKHIKYYRMALPKRIPTKEFTKKHRIKSIDFNACNYWAKTGNIPKNSNDKTITVSKTQIVNNDYNLDFLNENTSTITNENASSLLKFLRQELDKTMHSITIEDRKLKEGNSND